MKVAFFYLNGTDPLFVRLAGFLGRLIQQPQVGILSVPGYPTNVGWLNGAPSNDPFCSMLDPEIFLATKLWYPAIGVPISASINVGIASLVGAISLLPPGQKFMFGGYSQGAAAASMVYKMLQPGGVLHGKSGDWLGSVTFGNPMRQVDHRGEVGGTWSGKWDGPGDTGGHGSFPSVGPFARLTNSDPTKWIDFADYDDIITATGDSPNGVAWVGGNEAFLDLLNIPAVLNAIGPYWNGIQAAFDKAGQSQNLTDATGRIFPAPGLGHTAYPFRPPPGDPDSGLTSYQIAVKWLTAKASEYAVSGTLLPFLPFKPAGAGWSTTLLPPA